MMVKRCGITGLVESGNYAVAGGTIRTGRISEQIRDVPAAGGGRQDRSGQPFVAGYGKPVYKGVVRSGLSGPLSSGRLAPSAIETEKITGHQK
jgi:hypothetical protein